MIEALTTWAVQRRTLLLATLLVAAAAAGFQARALPLDALPDLTNNQVIVLTSAPGMSPEEVELSVSRSLELALSGLADVTEQRSLSRYGISAVTVVFDDAVDAWRARQMVAERIASAALPPGVGVPEMAPLTGGLGEIFHITVASPRRTTAELRELALLRVAPLLKAVGGVVEVNTWGGAQRTWDVIADADALAARRLQLTDVESALRTSSEVVPAGALEHDEAQVLLRAQSRPLALSELAAITLPNATRVSDVARVQEGQLLRLGAATQNGRGESVYLMVQMLRDANALDVTQRIHARMPAVIAALPDDVTVSTVYDRSDLVLRTLRTVARNLLEGFALVSLVLFAFLGSWRAGLIVASVIPLSMLLTTALMATLKLPGNLMSLGALDFGLLVDGAVVMVEGVFHAARVTHDPQRPPWVDHVRITATRAARPVFFAVITIVLVYVPVLAMTGTDGKLFRPMALTVVIALAFSLLLSLTYVPALCAAWLRPEHVPARSPWLIRVVERVYPRLLRPLLPRRWLMLTVTFALVGAGLLALRSRGVEFTPQLDEGDLVIQTTQAPDVSLQTSVQRALSLETLLRQQFPEVRRVVTRVGSPAVATDIMGLEQADVFVGLKPRAQWRPGLTRDALVEQMQRAIETHLPAQELSFTQPIQMRFNELLGGAVTDVAVSVYSDDLDDLTRTANALAAAIARVPAAKDVRVLSPPSVPVTSVRPRVLAATQHGLRPSEVLQAVQALRLGVTVGETREESTRIPLRLLVHGARHIDDLPQVRVPVADGGLVTLSQLADIEHGQAPGLVNRHNGQRRMVIGFNVRGADLASVVNDAQRAAAAVTLPSGARLEWGGQYASLQAASARLALIVPLVLVSIVVLLVIALGHARTALGVFTVVPVAAVGGVLTLALRAMPISLPAAIGFIALSGIAVMNGVVWMSRALELEQEISDAHEVARAAALQRVVPVLMTALVAAFGFIPMMLSTTDGAEVQRPLATVVVGGLVTSTWLTLFVLPVLYPWLRPRPARTEP